MADKSSVQSLLAPYSDKQILEAADGIMLGKDGARRVRARLELEGPACSQVVGATRHYQSSFEDFLETQRAAEEVRRRLREPVPTHYWDPEDVDLL